MTPYFILLSVPAVLCIFARAQPNTALRTVVMIGFILMLALRYRVGMDWNNYDIIHERLTELTFWEVMLHSEPASHGLFWVSMLLRDDMLFTNTVAAAILIFGVFEFSRRTSSFWLSVLSTTPYLIIVFGMTGIRQAMAVGILLYLLSKWEKTRFPGQILVVFVASLFHTSALLNLLLVALRQKMTLTFKLLNALLLLIAGFVVARSFFAFSDSVEFYQESYLGGEESIISPGALMHVALVWLPAIGYLSLRRRLAPRMHSHRLMDLGSIGALFLLLLYFVSSTAASRMTLYLYFVAIMFYPEFVRAFGERNRLALTIVVVLGHYAVLAIWLLYANNAIAYIPYQTIFEF